MSDYLDYIDEIYEELVDEFGNRVQLYPRVKSCDTNHIPDTACRVDKIK